MGASDPMLLTLPRPANADFGFKHAHDFIPPPPISTKRPSIKADQDALPSLPAAASEKMGTPHRGLPPPSAMALGPEPGRSIPPPLSSSFTGMPEPPRQWQGAEESMSRWLLTKAEEEKRKQEEERTRQESLKLEQRRIEQGILLEAIRSGIPPHLVPIIFAGIGSHSVANLSVEWLQQYNNSLHSAQQQQLTGQNQPIGSPDARRERLLAAPQPYPPSAPVASVAASGPPPAGPSSAPYSYPPNPMSPSMRSQQPPPPPPGPPSSGVRGPLQQVLPRLATEEQRPGPSHQPPSGAVQPTQVPMGQPERTSPSPGGGIFFHHWQPPSSQAAGGNPPPTPSEYTISPKRRKAQVPQPPSMPPTSEPRYNSSSFVHVTSPAGSTSGGRKRRLSDTSTTNRPGYVGGGRKNRSRGNTESSAAISEEDRLRYRQYPVGGTFEDRSDTGSHSSNYHHQQAAKRSRRSYDHANVSGPDSPKREQLATALSSRKSSFGPAG